MITPNAIERVLNDDKVIAHYGTEWVEWMNHYLQENIPLNNDTDAPVPKWAIDLLISKAVGYHNRIRMVLLHQWDITGQNPEELKIKRKDVDNAPPLPLPDWLIKFREKHTAIAREYLERKDKEKETQHE